MTAQTRGILFACTTALLWGLLAVALEMGLNILQAATIVWFRFFFSFLALLLVIVLKKKSLPKLRELPKAGILSGLFLGINYYAFLQGVSYTSPSNVQIIIQCGPLLLALAGFFLFGEKLSWIQGLGYLFAVSGFLIFYREQLGFWVGRDQDYQMGILWILLAAITWAFYAVIQKIIGKNYRPQYSNLVIYAVAALVFFPMADIESVIKVPTQWWPLMLFLALNTLVAYGCLAEAFNLIPANKIGMIITLNPLITLLIMKLLSAIGYQHIRVERIEFWGAVGAVLVIIGAVLVVGRFGKGRLARK